MGCEKSQEDRSPDRTCPGVEFVRFSPTIVMRVPSDLTKVERSAELKLLKEAILRLRKAGELWKPGEAHELIHIDSFGTLEERAIVVTSFCPTMLRELKDNCDLALVRDETGCREMRWFPLVSP